MSSEDTQKRLNENYRLIPMKDITDEARDIAVMWIEGYKPAGIINLEQKHKLASDIMNYAAYYAKEQAIAFTKWIAQRDGAVQMSLNHHNWYYESDHDGDFPVTEETLFEKFIESQNK